MGTGIQTVSRDGLGRYRDLLRSPEAGKLLGASVASRFPMWVATIALVIFVREQTGSFLRAGVVLAASHASSAIVSPMTGRIADRFGHRRTLLTTGGAYGVLMGGFVVAGYLVPENMVALVGCAALSSAAAPPLNACVRVMWGRMGDARTRLVAYAFDHVVSDVMAVGGRLAAAGLLLSVPSGVVVAGCVAMGVVGSVWLGTVRAGVPAEAVPAQSLWGWGAIGIRGVRFLVLASACLGYAIGALTLCVLAVAASEGKPYLGPIALALFSGAGIVGGVWYGARANPVDVPRRLAALNWWFAAGVAVVSASPGIGLLCLLVLAPGLVAPTIMSTTQVLIDHVATSATLTEARAWIATAVGSGLAVGSAVSGVLLNVLCWRAPVLVAAGVVTLAGAVAMATRSTFGGRGATR